MIAALICVVALIATFVATKRSLGLGLIAVVTTGYFYGILRANFITAASHFIFDSSLMGLYVAFGYRFFSPADGGRSSTLRAWTLLLMAWPLLLCLAPFQPLLVSIVGLRGNIFFLPILLIGSQLKHKDLRQVALSLALLNLLSLGIAVAEYFKGIEAFFPRSEVTLIMYSSKDVAGGHYRIPSLFTSAAAYAGAMVNTLPLLFGSWAQPEEPARRKLLLLLGMMAAMAGVLMAATRTGFVATAYLVMIALLTGKLSFKKRVLLASAVLLVGVLAVTNDRFGRFKTLADSDYVEARIAGSVNRGFFEILTEYPMGNGLGGGGTSMPYFLQDRIHNLVVSENEYSRILSEQGIIGLLFWISFVVWCLTQRNAFLPSRWRACRRLTFYWCAFTFMTAALGLGLLTAIPGTFFFLLSIGWITMAPSKEEVASAPLLIRAQPFKRAAIAR